MTTITIELPDELVEEARTYGLLRTDAVEAMIRDTLRRHAGQELLDAAKKLAVADFPPMALSEIQREVDAVREERRRHATDA